MQDFLDVVLPPVLLMMITAVVTVAAVVITLSRLRLYARQRRRLSAEPKIIEEARGALAVLIADNNVSKFTRDSVIEAYDVLGRIAKRKKELS